MSAYSFYLPLLLSGAFGLIAPRLTDELPPRLATWLLTGGGVLLAAASSVSLALLAFRAIGQLPFIAAFGSWSDDFIRLRNPRSAPVGTLAAVLVVVFAARFSRIGLTRLRATRSAYRLAAALPRQGGELSLLDVDARRAYAIPGRPGCIVVSRGMLRELDAGQRRALLAHERAHLDHHHHVHQTAGYLVTAVNPLLRKVPAALARSTERWADEDAAQVCPRDVVAEAVTRAAIGRSTDDTPGIALCAGVTDVAARIRALREPKPRVSLWPPLIVVTLSVGSVVSAVSAWRATEGLFELAQSAYRAGGR